MVILSSLGANDYAEAGLSFTDGRIHRVALVFPFSLVPIIV